MGVFFPEIASDLSVFHRQRDLTAWDAEQFGALVDRLAHYDGAVRAARSVQRYAPEIVSAPDAAGRAQLHRAPRPISTAHDNALLGAAPQLGQDVPVLKVNQL